MTLSFRLWYGCLVDKVLGFIQLNCPWHSRQCSVAPELSHFPLKLSMHIWPRLYGTIEAHKSEKIFPMRFIVSTIGTSPYRISKYLVDIIQPTLNKNQYKVKNSKSFVSQAHPWKIKPDEIQIWCHKPLSINTHR